MILAQVPLGSYGYLTNGDYFKLPDSSLNERKQFMEGLLTVILWPGTVMARLVEFPPSLPIRNIEKN